MYDKQLVQQYRKIIRQAGFNESKNVLGYYYDNGLQKFSIMKTGPIFICYHNINTNGVWTLKQKSTGLLQLDICLQWIVNIIQNNL